MNCLKQEKIFQYTERLLEASERREVEEHLAACAACRALAGEYQQVDAALEAWPATEPSPEFDALVRQRIATQPAPTFFWDLVWHRGLAPVALALLLVVAGIAIYKARQHQPVAPPVAVAPADNPSSPQTVTVEAGSNGEDELILLENLPVLENYDLLANFEVLSEIPKGGKRVAN